MRPICYILDAEGIPQPTGSLAFAEWYETTDRTVKREQIGDVCVSTVFLGIDHSHDYAGDSPPVLWETIAFETGSDGKRHGGESEHYTSREAALAGHEAMCERVRKARH